MNLEKIKIKEAREEGVSEEEIYHCLAEDNIIACMDRAIVRRHIKILKKSNSLIERRNLDL
jgi:hypothetical protein